MSLEPACKALNVTRRHGVTTALAGVSAWLPAGRMNIVLGPSGSGKTTLLQCLAGLDLPSSGEVHCAGIRLTGLAPSALAAFRARHTGFVFQRFNLIGTLSARENVELPMRARGMRPDGAWIRRLFGDLEIDAVRERAPSEMSGGQRQRVAIARALAHRPAILFADEPTGNLDSASSRAVIELLRRVQSDYDATLVVVTHDDDVAAAGDFVVSLLDGRVSAVRGRAQRRPTSAPS
jgi:putative ABC transport system ATP-binding protein